MTTTSNGTYFMNEPGTFMQYDSLTKATAYKGKGKEKFGAEFVLAPDHPDVAPMKALAAKLAREEWGDNVDFATIEWPFKNGNKLSEKRIANGKAGDLYAGKVVMRPRSDFAVELSWRENGKTIAVQSDTDAAKSQVNQRFYRGVLALGGFTFKAMTVDERKFVTCYLNKVYSTGEGKRVGGGQSAEDAFKGYIGRAKTEDPTKGRVADDDIPF